MLVTPIKYHPPPTLDWRVQSLGALQSRIEGGGTKHGVGNREELTNFVNN